MDVARFRRAIASIQAVNAEDPNRLLFNGESRPKELAHAEMLTAWIKRLRPDAGEALLLAAHAHHIRRWAIPRDSHPAGRRGYLRWRIALHELHAEEVGRILTEAGYHTATIERVQDLVRKRNLRRDPDVQTLEDGLCLVFLETQLSDMRERHGADKMIEVLRKTWGKMSPQGQAAALELDLPPEDRRLIERALAGEDSGAA